jgi:hypothetical protein
MNLAILAIVTVFTFMVLVSVPSEKLYALFLPPSTNTPDNDNDNSLNQDCSQSAIGRDYSIPGMSAAERYY